METLRELNKDFLDKTLNKSSFDIKRIRESSALYYALEHSKINLEEFVNSDVDLALLKSAETKKATSTRLINKLEDFRFYYDDHYPRLKPLKNEHILELAIKLSIPYNIGLETRKTLDNYLLATNALNLVSTFYRFSHLGSLEDHNKKQSEAFGRSAIIEYKNGTYEGGFIGGILSDKENNHYLQFSNIGIKLEDKYKSVKYSSFILELLRLIPLEKIETCKI